MAPRPQHFTPLVLLAALALLVMAGCNEHTEKIRDIVANPSHFSGRTVTVAGEVTKVYELPTPLGLFNSLSAYRVSDGTNQIWVLSRAGAPVVGDKVGLKGTVRPEGKFGNTALGSVIEEQGRRVGR